MITEKLIFKIPYEIAPIPDDFATILGANYYEDWDFNDAGSLSLTGSLIDSITSSGLNGGVFSSSLGARPTMFTDATLGKDIAIFDGVSDYMEVLGSAANYNFLHDGSGGCIITVLQQRVSPASIATILSNGFGGGNVGFRSEISSLNIDRALASNAAGLIYFNPPSTAITNLTYNSNVKTFDVGNATAADKGNVILNGTDNLNNVNTGAPSVANADDNLLMGVQASFLRTGFFLDGRIARVIIADVLPTPTQLTQIQARLNYEYGTFPI